MRLRYALAALGLTVVGLSQYLKGYIGTPGPMGGLVLGGALMGGLFRGFCRNSGRAIFDRDGFAVFDADNVGVAGDKLNIVCDYADELIIASFFENELLAGFGAVKGDGGREDGQLSSFG